MTNHGFASQIAPNSNQFTTIYIIIGMAVGIGIFWHMPYLKQILLPFKIITVALHEFGHASVGVCTGAKIIGIKVNPDEGGVTEMRGGKQWLTLPAGYLGSSFWGSLMIFCGFNTFASKIVSVIIGLAMLITLYWARNWLTRIMTVIFVGSIALLWWLANSAGLRYFVLFVGTMSALYSLWDIIEDLIVRKINESDASQFSKICCGGCLPPQFWGAIWLIISFMFVAAAIICALLVFKDPDSTISYQ